LVLFSKGRGGEEGSTAPERSEVEAISRECEIGVYDGVVSIFGKRWKAARYKKPKAQLIRYYQKI
jgi:hypothetical protein